MFLEVDSCQPICQKVSCLCGIAAETWLRIPRKRTGEDHKIITNTIYLKIEQLSVLTSANYFLLMVIYYPYYCL